MSKQQKGGWPKRERFAIVVRPSPEIVAGLDRVAERASRSRSQVIEQWLAALVEVADLAASASHPLDAGLLGEEVLNRLAAMGCLSDVVKLGIAEREQQRRTIANRVELERGVGDEQRE